MDILEAPETKAFADPAEAQEQLTRTSHEHAQTNDDLVAAIERKMAADAVTKDTLARMAADIAANGRQTRELALKSARRPLDGASAARSPEQKQAFDAYIRSGDARPTLALDTKAMSVGAPADGGYLAPIEIEAEIGRRLAEISPIRAMASVRQVSAATYRKPFATSGFAVGWVAETAARPQTATPTLDALEFPAMELYAMPAATPQLLEDAAVDLERWIADEVETAFAEQESQAFVTGDGLAKPKGFLAYPQVADASWAWGSIGTIASGAAGGFAASNPSDRLVDLVYSVKAAYRQNGAFVMNRKTQAEIRKFKDAQGHYLWQPPAQAGGRASLMGFPVVESEHMPDIAAGATPIAFGDFRRGYLVVDRTGLRILRDPYSAKPYVLFYTTKRVGGGVQDFSAIKLMKIAAS
jgi:HK97 family phage major capsid protein